jgi:hypothetical protein
MDIPPACLVVSTFLIIAHPDLFLSASKRVYFERTKNIVRCGARASNKLRLPIRYARLARACRLFT